ncbi:MAG: UDP-N-acetylmuramate dehydrogenase [Gemmatimonadetes bacterium]|nr:UDP-N-acetylmuramate dehydrogenase [Gemmatimonadota bacterium]
MAKPFCILRENVPLAPFTTMVLGGPARYLAECTSLDEMRTCLEWAEAEGLSVQVLGGGSNVLFADAGYSGLVLKVGLSGVVFNGATVEVGAGEDWDEFVQCCVERGLAGVECLSGIPGSVGATPIQNVGAYGQEVKDTIVEVRALDRQTLEEIAFAPAECGFAYRQSRFKGADRDRFIVTSVTYRLDASGQPQIRYPELRRHVQDDRPTLATVRDAVLVLRRSKSMVIDPQDPNSRSVGSFFLNPVIDAEAFDALKDRYPNVPSFPDSAGVKVPAAWLVEQAGFHKGLQRGGAGISERHALALVNRGGTTREVLALAGEIREGVEQTFGIRLEREPVLVEEDGG